MKITIFKAGTHTSAEGRRISFSDADLAATAAAYDPARHQAPLVIGHPAHDAPAYGWVKALSVEGGRLVASFDEVSPAARELVAGGAYRHVSAQFYSPVSALSPAPGVYALRHVGLLGAQPPAVKGLGAVSFDEADPIELATFAEPREAWWDVAQLGRAVAALMRRAREKIIASHGLEAADAELPGWTVDDLDEAAGSLTEHANTLDRPTVPASFAEPDPVDLEETGVADPTDELARLRAENEALAADKARLEAERASFAEAEAVRVQAAERAADRAALDALVAQGRLAPGLLAPMATFLEAVSGDVVSFAEGEEARSPKAWFLGVLAQATPLVSFGEITAPTADPLTGPGTGEARVAARIHELVEGGASFAEASHQATQEFIAAQGAA